MKRYCISCGSPTEYSTKKPLFCSSCGKSFDKIQQAEVRPVVQKNLTQKKTIASKKHIEDENSDLDIDYDNDNDNLDQDDVIVPEISQLEVETDSQENFKNKGEKISSLIGTSSSKSKRNKIIKNSKISKKQILQDFAKEAGTSRRSKK
jgi:hypothetical protein